MKEVWKDISGYEGIYRVSSEGRVRRIKHTNKHHIGKSPTILKLANRGYLSVTLSNNGDRKMECVHQLVAKTFLTSPPRCPTCNTPYEINHKDQDRFNNRANNLEYVTHAENVRQSKEKHQKSCVKKLNDEKATEIKRLISEGVPYSKIKQQFGISTSTISQMAKGNIWAHIPMPPIKKKYLKLTGDDVTKIKRLLSDGVPSVRISNEFRISTGTICDINKGRLWTSVPFPSHVPQL